MERRVRVASAAEIFIAEEYYGRVERGVESERDRWEKE